MHIIRKEFEFSHICVHAFICVILMPLLQWGKLPAALMTGNNPFTDTLHSSFVLKIHCLAHPVPVLRELSASSVLQFSSAPAFLNYMQHTGRTGLGCMPLVNINIS